MADRLMGFESQLTELTEVEKAVLGMFGQEESTQEQLRVWFQEFSSTPSDTLSLLYLGVLLGESQRENDLIVHLEPHREGSCQASADS